MKSIFAGKRPVVVGPDYVSVTAYQTGNVTLECEVDNADTYRWTKPDGSIVATGKFNI